jgi:hypothetical protein
MVLDVPLEFKGKVAGTCAGAEACNVECGAAATGHCS